MNLDKIRRFNRYYARLLGIFDKKYLNMDYSVTEVRILGEISRNPGLTAKEIADFLSIDKGYMSRMISKFEKDELIDRLPSKTDGREKILCLTKKGNNLNSILDEKADQRIEEQVANLSEDDIDKLIKAMETIQNIFEKR